MWLRALGGVGIVLVLLLLCIPAWVVWHSQDLPEIDDADLLPEWVEIEPERNAFVKLEAAAALLVGTDRNEAPALLNADRASLEAFAPLVEANASALAALEGVLAGPGLQVPELESLDPESMKRAGEIDGWMWLAKLLALRGLLRGPDHEEGLADIFLALEFSRRVETARDGSLVHVMIGHLMRERALDALATWLGESRLDPESARSLSRRLDGFRSDPGAWARAMGVEYAILKRTVIPDLERTRDGEIPGQGTHVVHWLLPAHYYFHPKRTFQRFAERFRVVAENGGRFCAQLEPIPGSSDEESLSPLRIFFSPNGGGEVLLNVGSPDYHRYSYLRCATDSHLGAVQTIAALRAWQLEHGELPATLSELVPEYLDVVPEDAFDGQPLRWSRERAWLYSVGDDGSDDGGREGEAKPGDTSEPTFPLRFVGSAEARTPTREGSARRRKAFAAERRTRS